MREWKWWFKRRKTFAIIKTTKLKLKSEKTTNKKSVKEEKDLKTKTFASFNVVYERNRDWQGRPTKSPQELIDSVNNEDTK